MKKQFNSDLLLFQNQKKDSKGFKDHFENKIDLSNSELNREQLYQKEDINIDYLYLYQQILAHNIIKSFSNDVESQTQRDKIALLDVGSRLCDAAIFSSYFKTIYLEPKSPSTKNKITFIPGSNISIFNGEAQEINSYFIDNSIGIITSLHFQEEPWYSLFLALLMVIIELNLTGKEFIAIK